jgi:hypothetical protein
VANLREAIRRAESAQDGAGAGRAYLNLSDALLNSDPAEAAERAAGAIAHCRRVGDRYSLPVAVTNHVQALLLTGEWDKAAESFASQDEVDAMPYVGVLLRSFRGDAEGLAELLPADEQDWLDTEDPQSLAVAASVMAAAAASAGDHPRALRQAQLALSHADALGLRNDGVRWAWPLAADAALALGDVEEVSRLIEWLDAYLPGQVPALLRAESLRIRAKLLAARHEPQADAAFDHAIRAFRELKSPYHLALGLVDQAEYVADSDLGAARRLASEADGIARRLGAVPVVARAEVLLGGEDSALSPSLAEVAQPG